MPAHDSYRAKQQHDNQVPAQIIVSEECSSLVAKYANAIGLSECHKAGEFPIFLCTT